MLTAALDNTCRATGVSAQKLMAVRMLEQKRIRHEVFAFDDAIRSAVEVARETGVPAEQVLKTLVVEQEPPRASRTS